MLDVRLPIGLLFLVLGAMLTIYGYMNPPLEKLYFNQVGLPLNLNVPWGILMTLFGIIMVSLARLDRVAALERDLKAAADAKAGASDSDIVDVVDAG